MALIDGMRYQEARSLAVADKRTYYVNSHGYGANEYLLVEGGRGARCCAAAHPDGEIELIVQDPFWVAKKFGEVAV